MTVVFEGQIDALLLQKYNNKCNDTIHDANVNYMPPHRSMELKQDAKMMLCIVGNGTCPRVLHLLVCANSHLAGILCVAWSTKCRKVLNVLL